METCSKCSNCSCALSLFALLLMSMQVRAKNSEVEYVENKPKITGRYGRQRRFLIEQLRNSNSKLNELIRLSHEPTDTTLSHFGLSPYDIPKSQKKIADEQKLSEDSIFFRINSVLCYLGFPTKNLRAKVLAERIERWVTRERKKLAKEKGEKEANRIEKNQLSDLGISAFPKDLPEKSRNTFGVILSAYKNGKLNGKDEKHRIVLLRYGLLEGYPNAYHSSKKTGRLMGHRSQIIDRIEQEVLIQIR